MIVDAEGDLLAAEADALVNTVNCVGVMGKGIALQFKRRYPDMFDDYRRACKQGLVSIGKMHVFQTHQLDGPEYIINFPTKRHWRSPSKLSYIDEGLRDLIDVAEQLAITRIAVPPLGAGNGGLDWSEVRPLLVAAFSRHPEIEVLLYAPTEKIRKLDATRGLKMTWGVALALNLIRNYAERRSALEPWETSTGASHLEVQKLLYFAEHFDPVLNLSFVPARYGPYSERVRHLLQDIEGAYTSGFGDGTSRTLDGNPIELTDTGAAELKALLGTSAGARVVELTDRVLQAIEGFEGAYGLELLASTHWVAARQAAEDELDAAVAVREWTDRKGRIYSDDRVAIAFKHLQSHGMTGPSSLESH